jgi:hypothetical protein
MQKDLIHRRFGKLVALKRIGTRNKRALWLCRCDCGKKKKVTSKNLIDKQTKSCGCIWRKGSHEHWGTPEYWAYWNMLQRCYSSKYRCYRRYGGRGITVCARWRESFENFIADMGHKPSPRHTLDRFPSPDGNYEPGNCRWATWKQQANNKGKL